MSFLSDYREYASGNEAPPTYHLFASLAALSSIVSRRVWIDQSYFTFFPNLYIVLVGPPGARKSTAISIARGLLHALKTVPFSGECTSKEKLILDIVATERAIGDLPEEHAKHRLYSPLAIMASELSEFFQISGDGMVGFLTDVFDISFPYEHKTKNKGSVIVNGPYIVILAGTTPSWMTSYLREDIITGGFTRRCLFVLETDRHQRIAFPGITDSQRAAWQSVYLAAERIQKLRGQFTWTPAAHSWYKHWYETNTFPTAPNTIGYYENRHVQLLKIAMLVAISETEKLVLDTPHLESGLAFLGLIERNLDRVFEGLGRNELNAVASKILDLIRTAPPRTITLLDGTKSEQRWLPMKLLQKVIYAELPTNLPDAFERVLSQLTQTDRIERKSFAIDGVTREYLRIK